VAVTGLHRKAAIRLLGRAPRTRPTPGPGGRPRAYGREVAAAAEVLWQASGRIGAHRLHPFVSELLDRLLLWGELTVTPQVDKLLRQISRPTLARVLEPARAQFPLRGATITRPSHLLRQEIPVRTFTDWDDARPGFLEVDLVAHCGSSTQGFYLCTLCAVDIPTAWIELDAVWGKNQSRAAQLTLTNGPRRDEAAWMALATRSLPTPLSPRIKTVVSVSAILAMTVPMARIWGFRRGTDSRVRDRPPAQCSRVPLHREDLNGRASRRSPRNSCYGFTGTSTRLSPVLTRTRRSIGADRRVGTVAR